MGFERITADPAVMSGVPCIRGTRIPVATVVDMVAEGVSTDEIVTEYPRLDVADVQDALRFAAAAVDELTLPEQRRVRIDPDYAEAFYAALDDASPVPQRQRLADVPEPDLP